MCEGIMNKKRILELLSNALNLSVEALMKLPEDTSLTELGMESICFIKFIVALEEEYGIEIMDSDLVPDNYKTLEMLYATLKKYNNGLKKF